MFANGPTHFTMAGHHGHHDAPGMSTLLGFFSTRILRGGPKILLYLATSLAVVLVVLRSMPEGLSDMAFGSISTDVAMGFWSWSPNLNSQEGDARYDVDKGLRIVVFGGGDVATPAQGSRSSGARSWTDSLCDQVCGPSTVSTNTPVVRKALLMLFLVATLLQLLLHDTQR